MPGIVLLALTLGGLGAFVWFVGRPRVAVDLSGGKAVLRRGQLPPGLLSELDDIARTGPELVGRVEIRGRGATLKVAVLGLTEGPAQRVRNVLMLRRDQL